MSSQPRSTPNGGAGERREGMTILSLSVHGLVRGRDLELGRDADTGGQVAYVLDQARALARHDRIRQVDLVTRAVHGRNVSDDYAEPEEPLADGARIVRVAFGPRRYLRKESLWPHLDSMLDQLMGHLRERGQVPDIVHGHYADAGYVGAQLAKLLGAPFVFTGHSLGRVKRERLLADGMDAETLEQRFRISKRIEAEERALETAAVVIASTQQEVDEQYALYDHYPPERMVVIPPGVDLSRFAPPAEAHDADPPVARDLARFLQHPERPMVLAIARPDERKNLHGLVEAFATTPALREKANLVVVAGNRSELSEMPAGPRRVIRGLFELVDRHDLYGSVAYPKRHDADDIPDLYRLAARTGGVFVNPALTEPFGLTLIEAAASGLPVVATDDGGPNEIIGTCENGLLVDPFDTDAIGRAVAEALSDRARWERWSRNGVEAAHRAFSWRAHARRYAEVVGPLLRHEVRSLEQRRARRLTRVDRMLVTDVDNTLTGDDEALDELRSRLAEAGPTVGFAVATGRSLERALALLDELALKPDVLITSSGTELHYGRDRLTRDRSWERQIAYRWEREAIREKLEAMDGVRPGDPEGQTERRLHFVLDTEADDAPGLADVRRHLRQAGLRATVIVDHGKSLEVVPVRASPGLAIRFLCNKWRLDAGRLLVAGDSGNDRDMLSGDTLGVVVANHTPELEDLRGRHRVYFASTSHARGVLEGIDHYDFLGEIRIPDEPEPEPEPEPETDDEESAVAAQ